MNLFSYNDISISLNDYITFFYSNIFIDQLTSHFLATWCDSLEENHDAGKDWGQEEKGATEDEMVGGHHQIGRHEFEQTLGDDSEGQGSLVCYSPWCYKESDMTATEQQQIS